MKKISKSIKLIYLLFSAVLLFACSDDDNIPNTESENGSNINSEIEINPSEGINLYGFIGDENDDPLSGVVVSDGFSCVATNEKGVYEMKRNEEATHVFYSVPSDCEINTFSPTVSMASFYQPLTDAQRYDFKLKKLAQEETNFTFLCIGDPQVKDDSQIKRFRNEIMDDIDDFKKSSSKPIYALAMGDMVHDKPALFNPMKEAIGSIGIPVFTTIGNHDKVASLDNNEPRNSKQFCEVYGPLNYSFNRGNVHFICLDNVMFSNSTDYGAGFTDEQVEWLKADLSFVPKNKMIVCFYHIPIRNSNSIVVRNKAQILELFSGYAEVHLMCGHTHYNDNFQLTTPVSAYEHIHAASCGAWWKSVVNGDGTPNGYGVYEVNDVNMENWFYKSAQFDQSHQFRLHWGDAVFGTFNGGYTYGKPDYTLIGNIWNADSSWEIKVYVDDEYKGEMKKLNLKKDAWAMGYHIGVLNLSVSTYTTTTNHLYYYNLKGVDRNANIRVVATDGFGNVYEETNITTTLDTAEKYLE